MRSLRTRSVRLLAATVFMAGTVALPLLHQLEHAHTHDHDDKPGEAEHYAEALASARALASASPLQAEFDAAEARDHAGEGAEPGHHHPGARHPHSEHQHHDRPGAPHGEGSLFHHSLSLPGAPAPVVFTTTVVLLANLRTASPQSRTTPPAQGLPHPRGPPLA